MNPLLKKLPQWLLIVIAIYLMGLVAYSIKRGATVKFWPPEITPSTSSVPISSTVDVSQTQGVVFTGKLSSQEKVRAHAFSLNRTGVLYIQPKTTSTTSLYFDLTVQSPSGNITTAERYKSLDAANRFSCDAREPGVYLLMVAKRTDSGNLDGPYLVEVSLH